MISATSGVVLWASESLGTPSSVLVIGALFTGLGGIITPIALAIVDVVKDKKSRAVELAAMQAQIDAAEAQIAAGQAERQQMKLDWADDSEEKDREIQKLRIDEELLKRESTYQREEIAKIRRLVPVGPDEDTDLVTPHPGDSFSWTEPRASVEKPIGTILIVDDEGDIVRKLAKLMRNLRWRTMTATSVSQALDAFKRETPQVVLLDLMMPDGGGERILKTIRADPKLKDVRVVVLTGLADLELVAIRALGVEGVLSKPYQVVELLEAIGDPTEG